MVWSYRQNCARGLSVSLHPRIWTLISSGWFHGRSLANARVHIQKVQLLVQRCGEYLRIVCDLVLSAQEKSPECHAGVQSLGYQHVLKSRQIPQSLQELCLTRVPLPSATLRAVLEQCNQLRSIKLSDCTFHANQFLMPATSLVSLTSMEIRSCKMSPKLAMQTIAVALNLPQLHALVLNDCCSVTACMDSNNHEGHERVMRDIKAGNLCHMAVLDIGALPAPGDAIQVQPCPLHAVYLPEATFSARRLAVRIPGHLALVNMVHCAFGVEVDEACA